MLQLSMLDGPLSLRVTLAAVQTIQPRSDIFVKTTGEAKLTDSPE